MYVFVQGRCKGPADAGEELEQVKNFDNVQGKSRSCTYKDCNCTCRSSSIMAEVNTISPSPAAGTQLPRLGKLMGRAKSILKRGGN